MNKSKTGCGCASQKEGNLPIDPQEIMRNQVSFDTPDIEDEDYHPTTVADLSHAAYAVAQGIPKDKVEDFYKEIKKVALKFMQENNMSKDISESYRKAIRDILKEAKGDPNRLEKSEKSFDDAAQRAWDEKRKGKTVRREKELTDFRSGKSDKTYPLPAWKRRGEGDLPSMMDDEDVIPTNSFDEDLDDDDVELPAAPSPADDMPAWDPTRKGMKKGGGWHGTHMGWEAVADEMGFAGAPGARQFGDRTIKKLQFMLDINPEEFDKIRDNAVRQYVDVLQQEEAIDDEDAQVLLTHPEFTSQLDTFKEFFSDIIRRMLKASEKLK